MNSISSVTRRLATKQAHLDVRRWYRYAVTIFVMLSAMAITRVFLPPVHGTFPMTVLFAALVVSAWVWGTGPGVLAAVMTGLWLEFSLISQTSGLGNPTDDLIRFVALTGVAVLISYVRPAWRRPSSSQPITQVPAVPQPILHTSSQIASTVLDSIKDAAISMVDHAWRFTYANEEAAKLLGRPREQLIGSTLFAAITDAKGSEWFKKLQQAMEGTSANHFEGYVSSLKAWLQFHCYPSPEGLCFNFSNINDRKRQEALSPLPLWNDDSQFAKILNKIEYTLVDRSRCYMLYQFAKQARELPGDVAEVGVYKGGTAKLLAETVSCKPDKVLHLFDTFEGMPATDPKVDHHRAGDFADTSLEAVQKQLRDNPNARFYKGFFPATAGPIEKGHFCFVHVDADIYQSVKDCCSFFYPRLEKGGVLIFDDYGFPSCPGARKAVDEFFADKPESPFYLPSGQSVVVRK